MKLRTVTMILSAAALLQACTSAEWARHQGLSALDEGRVEEGLGKLDEAVGKDPTKASLRRDMLYQRELNINRLLAAAANQRLTGHPAEAEASYQRVLAIDPANPAAQRGLADMEVERRHERLLDDAETRLAQGDVNGARALIGVVQVENAANARAQLLRSRADEPNLRDTLSGPTLNVKGRKPLTLQFRDANLKMVLEAIARTTGINILVDREVRNDGKVTLFVRDTPVDETLDLLLVQNQLEKRVLGPNTVMIYPLTPAKVKDYQDLKVRRFALGNADPKQVQSMLKTIVKTRDIFVDEKTSSVVMRDSPQAVRLAEKLVAAMDAPEPEVMLEIDVMQVDRDRLMSLGIDWTKSFTWSLKEKMSLQDFKNRTLADVTIPGFSVTANMSKTDGDVNDLATPRIRVRNKEKAKILVGSRNPVVSSAATPAPTGGGSTVYNTAVQYIETGIKVEVEPHIHPDGDVAIKLSLEVSSAGAQIDTGTSGTVVFPINTNNINTLLQLRDGETQILGGLLQHQFDQSQTKIPGLGDVPLLGRLFGSVKDTWNKRELLVAITPHVIRNVPGREADLVEFWSGTEANVRYGAPNLRASGGSGLTTLPAAPAPTTPAMLVPAPVAPPPAPAAAERAERAETEPPAEPAKP